MARKAIVDRNTVLQLLKEGKTSQSIASQFGVSRQAIDLHRKEFIRTGLLQGTSAPLPAIKQPPVTATPVSSRPTSTISPQDTSLDQMIELLIKAFSALKHVPELEAKVEKYRHDYDKLFKQLQELEESEKKRKEQEARWTNAQNPDVLPNHQG
jgi:hypothetical protein